MSDAARLYESFTELPADERVMSEIPMPKELERLGEIVHVIYISNKWHEREGRSGEDAWMRYIHDWKANPPILCQDPENEHFHILGKCVVKDTGINDWRGKAPSIGGRPSYDIPKELTFLGYLEEIVYEDDEDGQDYKIEFDKQTTALCSNASGLRLFIAKYQ